MKYKHLIKVIKWIWVATVIIASGYFLISHFEQVESYFRITPAFSLFFAAIFLVSGKLALVFISKYSVESEGKNLSYVDIFCIVTFTQLAKYIPGGIWHFVGRYGAYNSQNITFKKTTRALISENVWLLSGAFLTGSVTGLLSLQGQHLLTQAGVHVPIFLLVMSIVLLWLVLLIGYKEYFITESSVPFLRVLGAQLISWLCLGISFAFVMPSLNFETILFDISAYSFGWLIGYIAIFAPGGIGVRETALIWMLSGVTGSENAVIYSTVHRLLFMVVEVMLGAIASLIHISKTRISQHQTITSEKNGEFYE